MMLERDLQDYLFENPDVLFPSQIISRKRREVYIEGRRIDLLFEVEGIQYIVELKRDTIKREDIGQVFEYYGLMRQSNETASFRMILVAPSIPEYRRIPLEEFGIRCVEVPHPSLAVQQQVAKVRNAVQKKRPDSAVAVLPSISQIKFEDVLPPTTPMSLQLSHLLLREGLQFVQKSFSEYEVKPIRMSVPKDVLCLPEREADYSFVRGGLWWAFSFGHSEEMPKNDVPNISVNALPWGLDFAVNAELRTSQEVMRKRVERCPDRFNRLVQEHGHLELQAWLKLEHQPRIYHWIPLVRRLPATWQASDLLDIYRRHEINFSQLRAHWLTYIEEHRTELAPGQAAHMRRTNQNLNLALRLVKIFQNDDAVWKHSFEEQKTQFNSEYLNLKPIIDFFQ